jgi:N-methylhydantoinase B
LRRGSGGSGQARGGDGIVREYELLTETEITILSERRVRGPYGLAGGAPGRPGVNTLVRDGIERPLPGKVTFRARPGDILRIETPGGGGWLQLVGDAVEVE